MVNVPIYLRTLLFVICCFPFTASAGFHYCTGKVIDIVTRGSHEGTHIKIEGLNNFAKLGYGGPTFKDMHERQYAMILSAFVSDISVTLEFVDEEGVTSCNDDHKDALIRFVRVRK